jgi:methanethiol S-methyltransferase
MSERGGSTVAIAWGGALLFAVSQVWFLYCYFIRFDRLPTNLGVVLAVAIDGLLFTVFALHHSILARTGAKAFVERLVTLELERSLYTWVASALFIIVCAEWKAVPGLLYRLDGVWRLAGYGVQVLGIVLTVRASRALDVLNLAGVRRAQRAGTGETGVNALKTTGLYGFVRHPLYFAWTLMVFGTPDMTATRLVFAFVSTGYLALAIPWEERGLMATFGADYEAYRKVVRWRMVPGLY